MRTHFDLSDPSCEPSGEELQALAARAFAGVGAQHVKSLEELRLEIARQRELVLRSLQRPANEKGEPTP
jgi:hypothetical protein